jgi:enoyl-CoA hydratase/carnithine racemase
MPKKAAPIPRLRVRKGATLKEIYAAYRKQFTAADLQKYTVIEPMVPAEQVLAEVEAIHKEVMAKKAKKVRRKA